MLRAMQTFARMHRPVRHRLAYDLVPKGSVGLSDSSPKLLEFA